MNSAPEQPETQPASGITIDSRLAWGLVSAVAMALGSVGAWATAGPFSVTGTTGSGDGWITLAIAVALGVLVAVRRLPWLALPGAMVAGGIGIGDAIRLLDAEESEWFSVSVGWGLVLVIAASVSLAAWGAATLTVTPSRQRVVAGVLSALALAGAVALGLDDRTGNDPGDRANTTLLDAAESVDDDSAASVDSDTGADEAPAAAADDAELDDSPDASAETTTDAESESATRKETTIGVAATDDDVTFKVESFERVTSIATDEYSDGPIVPAAGSKLYVATVTWKNNMTTSADIFCGGGSTVLVDEKGRNFDPDTDSMLDIPDNSVCRDEVQPGFKQSVKLVFRTPKDARPSSLALWNNAAEEDYNGDATYVGVALGN